MITEIRTKWLLSILVVLTTINPGWAQDLFVHPTERNGDFCIASVTKHNSIYISEHDHIGVIKAATDLKQDIGRVTGHEPLMELAKIPVANEVIIIGSLDLSPVIKELVNAKKISVTAIEGKWEAFQIQVVNNPFPNVKRALVIVGSDKRGTIYGIYELSKQIGVSPWYWWADVPPKKSKSLFVSSKVFMTNNPVVKYRGIFLNDEEPALGRWAVEKYGGFNHQFYEKLFELILRLKGNYIWPAMWWASFNSDDTLNPKFANDYGIVMGTSHHEPMTRAHAEWKKINGGEWNYETNQAKLDSFWTAGIRRMSNYESIVTLAMRGDGDKAMTAETNTALLEKIVKKQREIIHDVTGKEPQETPQLWALYKEVQDYYDKGMRVPDDVLLLLCDDNWGNIRKLPRLSDAPHKGGYGIYYHFDYVGDPRNYKWVNTNPLPRIWEQMNLAYHYGATQLWLVNVGDLKPMEFPTSFFLDYAWNPEKIKATDLDNYTLQWVTQQFGSAHSAKIASLLSTYAKHNARRKPELLEAETYSLSNYREAETIVAEYSTLLNEAERIFKALPLVYQDAYYQLILHPIKACANINTMYVMQAKNKRNAKQGRSSTNDYADSVGLLFRNDSIYSHYYNKELANGKWNHMMDQTHISYTYWQQPEKDVIPATKKNVIPVESSMGVSVEGSEDWWPQTNELTLPEFDFYNKQQYYIEIFNAGKNPFTVQLTSSSPELKLSSTQLTITKEKRILVSVDWNKVPVRKTIASISITALGKTATIKVPITNQRELSKGFMESNGYISIEANHYSKAVNTSEITWHVLPGLGRTNSAVTAFPVTAAPQKLTMNGAHLEYKISTISSGPCTIQSYFSPTIDFHQDGGLKYAISVDDEAPKIPNLQEDKSNEAWQKSVRDNIIICNSLHELKAPGEHIVKFWMIDSGVVLQKIVVDFGGLKPSYLGPPESFLQK